MLRDANADDPAVRLARDRRRSSRRTIDGYQKAAGDHADLTPARRRRRALTAALDGFYAGIAAGRSSQSAANDGAACGSPASSCRSTSPASRASATTRPITVPPLPTLAVAAELPRLPTAAASASRKTQLLRGQNRFVAAMREAERIVAQALHPSSA